MSEARDGTSYVLPLRWSEDQDLAELAAYLKRIAAAADEVIVVDGSAPERFELHRRVLPGVRHIHPDPDLDFAMGKVNGVVTGVREARHERVVIADDDIRYRPDELIRATQMLDGCELVRPQNYFRPLPWHARWDTARSLLNRVFSGDLVWPAADFPGTLVVRRSFFIAAGAYDGNVMFENLELIRTVHAAGGRVCSPLDLYVERRPPTTRHFLSQRVRQAYDDFALPLRMGLFLVAGPLLAAAAIGRRFRALAVAALGIVAVAEAGRRRAGGAAVFSRVGGLLAPTWVLERAVCAWLAVLARMRGGVRYGGRTIRRSATPLRELKRRYPSAPSPAPARRTATGESSRAPAASNPTSL